MVFSSGTAAWQAQSSKAEGALAKESLSKCRIFVESLDQEVGHCGDLWGCEPATIGSIGTDWFF